MVIASLCVMILLAPSLSRPWSHAALWGGLAAFLLANFWIFARWAERQAYDRIAHQDRFERCPICRYDFAGLADDTEPERCPECGEHLTTLRRDAGIIAGTATSSAPRKKSGSA